MKSFFPVFFILALVFLPALETNAQSVSVDEFFLEKARNAKEQGDYSEAILQYDMLIEKFPNNPEYAFLKAMSYYRMGDFSTTIQLAQQLVNTYPFTPKYYRLLGNSYDLSGDYYTALEIFEMGNANIINCGELYLDMGVIEMIREDKFRAINFWEKGIEKAPNFADNYFWLAKTYASTNEKVWVLVYGEMFLSLEKSTDRFNEISLLIYKTYIELLYGNASDYDLFLPRDKVNNLYDAYRQIIEQIKNEGILPAPMSIAMSDNEVYLPGISIARKRFLELWNENYADWMKVPLFEYQSNMVRRGIYDSYNHWLMINGEPKYFMSWQKNNVLPYQKFINWFVSNPLRVSSENYIMRAKYESQH